MGLRRNVLVKLKDKINGVTANTQVLVAANGLFDPHQQERNLPKCGIHPAQETADISLAGTARDHTMGVLVLLFYYSSSSESLFLDGEDWLEAVIAQITTVSVVDEFVATGFSVTHYTANIDAIENEEKMGVIAINLTVEFVEGP